jgi:hypothetical protein
MFLNFDFCFLKNPWAKPETKKLAYTFTFKSLKNIFANKNYFQIWLLVFGLFSCNFDFIFKETCTEGK